MNDSGLFAASVQPVSFPSHDGESTISGQVWKPVGCKPCGVVQLVHGMAEHVARYDEFARYLVGLGYLVCAEDHIGHGKSAAPDKLGHIPVEGKEMLIEDVHTLRLAVQEGCPGVPYVIFGHSMGSFITRAYLARHGEGVAAAVLCGTGQQPVALSRAANDIARCLARVRGPQYRSKLLDQLGVGAYSKQVLQARTPLDWLSTRSSVVDDYIADDLCGAMFTVGGYATLTSLTGEVATDECAARVPKDLPVLFIAGDQDPVGACGEGVNAAADQMRQAGVADVQVILYPGMRHEVLNEPGRAQVYDDVACWMGERLCGQPTS